MHRQHPGKRKGQEVTQHSLGNNPIHNHEATVIAHTGTVLGRQDGHLKTPEIPRSGDTTALQDLRRLPTVMGKRRANRAEVIHINTDVGFHVYIKAATMVQ